MQEGNSGYCYANTDEGLHAIESTNSGFTGSGYINVSNRVGSKIVWHVQVEQAGNYEATLRFANGGSAARSGTLMVGDAEVANYTLINSTAGTPWSDWQTETVSIYLEAGEHILTLQAAGSDGLANIDSLTLSGAGTINPGSCDNQPPVNTSGAVRVEQMTSCDGLTSGLPAGNLVYITPNGNGSGSSFNDGMSIHSAISNAKAGQTLLLQPGTYNIPVKSNDRNTLELNASGSANAPIQLVAANCGRALFDFKYPANEWMKDNGKSFGFHLTGDYWYIKNIDVTNAGYHGIYIEQGSGNGSYNTIENSRFFNNRNTGLEINNGGSYNTIINVDAYENYDFKLRDDGSMGGMADGFASKQTQGPGNKFFGCRAWGNSDDGFDTYGNTDPVIIEHSWAFANGIDIWGSSFWASLGATFKGNGNGFKIGGSNAAQRNTVSHSIAFGNPANGFDLNSNTAGQKIYNNIGYQNGRNYDFDTSSTSEDHIFRNNISLAGKASDTFINADSAFNSWNSNSANNGDFINLDTSIAKVERNADGSIPDTGLFRLQAGSSLINAGTDIGKPYAGSAPDLGPFEVKE